MSRWPAPPKLARAFYKAHGLGNDYVVFEEGDDWTADAATVRRVCDPHRGIGSDGLVALLAERSEGLFHLRMFNPDGGEFERSGNGLRVLGSLLARRGVEPPFLVSVGGDRVRIDVHGAADGVYDLSVDMGRASTGAIAVGLEPDALVGGRVVGPLDESIEVMPVSVGNPHMVALDVEVSEERLALIGPFLSSHARLRHGANVQLAERVGPASARALIWERGVGRTSASGTSACAVAVAMVTTGRCEAGAIAVTMPGGVLQVTVSKDLDVRLRGPVEEVCEGVLAAPVVA